MQKVINIANKKFGYWTVLKFSGSKRGQALWLCRCHCGKKKIVLGYNLRNGFTKSCGCYHGQLMKKNPPARTHGLYGTKIYNTWHAMLQRCTNTNATKYPEYGGRGITVCKRWMKFENFFHDMGHRPPNCSIDRINNNGNYTPSNCRWATAKEQAKNQRKRRRN